MSKEAMKLALEALEGIHPGNMTPMAEEYWNKTIDALREALAEQPAQPAPVHPDDAAVDRFAAAMKNKLAKAREKGRSGWETCTSEGLSRMLREHVKKGDPRDVANFCMMLWNLGAGIAAAPQPAQPLTDEQIYTMYNEPRSDAEMTAFARAIEAAHDIKEKTND